MPQFTKEQIKEISEQLDCGFKAFYHKITGDLVFIPDTDRYMSIDTTVWKEELNLLKKHYKDYQEISAMEAKDSIRMMTDFTEEITDEKLKSKLSAALGRNRPFGDFKIVIGNSGECRQRWFDFKNKRYIEWTEEQIKAHVEIEEYEKAMVKTPRAPRKAE